MLNLILVLLAGVQEPDMPMACRYDAQGRVDYQACANATEPGTPLHQLSLINLGSVAALEGDYDRAVRFYDAARPSGDGALYSDSLFHSLRAHVYDRVGRTEEALVDARYAAGQLLRGEGHPVGGGGMNPNPEAALLYVLPILYRAGDADFEAALDAYMALPADDWMALGNRAVTLLDLVQYEAGLEANTQAMATGPEHPMLLNTQCYTLTLMGRPREGAPFCERAVALAPDIAPIRHSYASALAGAGRCAEAEAQLAEARRLDPVSVTYRDAIACSPA